MPSEHHSEDHSDAGTDDTGGRPDIFPMQVSRAEGVAEAGMARRGEDRLEGWRRRHHTDRNSHP